MTCNLCGWHARQKACPRVTRRREMWQWGLRRRSEYHINQRRFRSERTKKTSRRAIRRYAALGVAQNCEIWKKTELCQIRESREAKKIYVDLLPWYDHEENHEGREMSRNENDLVPWDNARFAKAEKRGKTKMIQCFEIMPDSRKQKSKERPRWFNALTKPCISLVKRRRSGLLKIRILLCL